MEAYTVSIEQIDWLDKEGAEAEIFFEINGKKLWAFCHPCNFTEGEIAEVYFSFIEEHISESAFWDENKDQKKDIVPSKNHRCYYYCYGQLKSIHPVIIDCGALTLSFGNWVNDERTIGSYVYFVISRLDMYRL